MVFGLGSGIGLGYLKMWGMPNPILGGRNNDFEKNLCSILKIGLNRFKTKNEEEGWLKLKERLKAGIPSVIHIDMAFLKYRDLPEDFHFGAHAIVVCGHNSHRSTVLVADTELSELQEITVEDLSLGRNCTEDKWLAPKNLIYEFTFPEKIPSLEAIIPQAIQRSGKSLLKRRRLLRLIGIWNGVEALAVFSKDLPKWTKLPIETLKQRFQEVSGFISSYGTGGGFFRYLFSRFLKESANLMNDDSLGALSDHYLRLGDTWEELSSLMIEIPEVSMNPHEVERKLTMINVKLAEIKQLELQGAKRLQNYQG